MSKMYKTRSGTRLAGCLALASSALLLLLPQAEASSVAVHEPTQPHSETGGGQEEQRLAVVVPAYRGDLERAVSSLGRWPATCSPVTEDNVDLVLYYAEGEEDSAAVEAAFDAIAASAGRCFSKTRTVFAHLEEEEDTYPKGPSVMFYKMFLDEGVRSEFSDYDALAIMEWDVLVATDNSFEELYHAAFRGNEDFWVKGSNLEGTNFHSSATVSDMWHVLGHINGNAIYNNNDPAFVEYVDYTRTRWSYTYPYDVALWLTISDFPYSWPLYQRYSNKFVTTNLIAYVGHDHVDHTTVSDAVAGKTLFIHGSSVDEGNIASIKATKPGKKKHNKRSENKHKTVETSRTRQRHRRQRRLQKWRDDRRWETLAKWQGDADNDADPRWMREEKWKGNNDDTDDSNDPADLPKWKRTKKWQRNVCDDGCESDDGDTGRACDTTCKDGDPWGKLGCSALDSMYGNYCRVCYNNIELARENDTEDDRAIMCDTMEPVVVYRRLNAVDKEGAPGVARRLQMWREKQRWKTLAKWQGDADNDVEPRWMREEHWKGNNDDTDDSNDPADLPKWKREKKWKNNVCHDGCESDDGDMGRACDTTCKDGDPYGKLGCSALNSLYGNYCRECYNDVEMARENDTEDDRAIMCDTMEPVVVYRRLNAVDKDGAPGVARRLQKWRDDQRWKALAKWKGDADKDVEPRWMREEHWKGNNDDTDDSDDPADLPKWKRDEKWKNNVCDDGCESDDGDMGRVCDTTCKDGDPYGKLGCSALDSLYGNYCRECYNDVELAREDDTEDDRAIMCDTMEPVTVYRRLNAADEESVSRVARKLQMWRNKQRWTTLAKWKGDADNDVEPRWMREEHWKGNNDDTDDSNDPADLPKWKREKKWENNICDDGCESDDGDMGRACDTSCKDGDPHGKLGCSALDSLYGNYCRVCYNDVELAREDDTEDDRAIMCDTMEPVEAYTRRRLKAANTGVVAPAPGSGEDAPTFFSEAAQRPYTEELVRDNLCAFVSGGAAEVDQVEVTVMSILQFVPGMRVAIATEADGVDDFEMAVGDLPGVTVSTTANVLTASLFADEYCGAGTSLIFYVKAGSVVSREITAKDTHSPHGDLLVMYSKDRTIRDERLVKQTTVLLGFEAPSFTHGTDLILPARANADLRSTLALAPGSNKKGGRQALVPDEVLSKLKDRSDVPQMLAALQYSRDTPGVWFFNPQTWVSHNLFKTASIWEIPLVKPRFTCEIYPLTNVENTAVAGILQRNLDFFAMGGACENGLISYEP